jgi:replicative DNA helicase
VAERQQQRRQPQQAHGHAELDAEAAVLSSIMLSVTARDEVRDLLEPEDFYSGANRTMYEGILELTDAGREIDPVTLAAHLRDTSRLQQIGGAAYIAQIVDATPSVANVLEHARIVHRLARLRRMGKALAELNAQANFVETRADVQGFIERCESVVFAINATGRVETDTGSALSDVMSGAAVQLDPSRPTEPRGLTTGFTDLNELSLGFCPGELWYIAARPGMGKTALALGMSASVAATGARSACFFSLEMKRPELGERLISWASGVPYKHLLTRRLSMDHYERAIATAAQLGRYPMILDDGSSLTPSRLRSRTRKHFAALRQRHPHARPGLVVVDYVQLMADDSSDGNRNDQLERISRSLKILAGELGVTVVALSQLTRPKDRASAEPTLTDLRGSGALEQDADKVLFVHRDEAEGDERGDATLILGKGRNAGKGRVRVTWEPWCVRFTEGVQGGFDYGPTDYDGPDSRELS